MSSMCPSAFLCDRPLIHCLPLLRRPLVLIALKGYHQMKLMAPLSFLMSHPFSILDNAPRSSHLSDEAACQDPFLYISPNLPE